MYTYLLIGLAIILAIVLWMKKSENGCEVPTPKKLVLFYSETCKACVNFRPTWEKLKQNHEDDASIVFLEIDAEKNPDERITAYPTIVLETSSGQYFFKDSREIEKLESFIKHTE